MTEEITFSVELNSWSESSDCMASDTLENAWVHADLLPEMYTVSLSGTTLTMTLPKDANDDTKVWYHEGEGKTISAPATMTGTFTFGGTT